MDVFVLVDAYILLEEQFQFGFSCCFGGLYYFFRFLGSGVYTFQRHFLLDVVAERAADAQVHVLELDGFGADFLFLVVGLAQAFQRSAEESEFSQFHDVSVGKEVAQLVNAGIQCCSYHILGQMLESCDMFHKLLLGISPFRADTCME